MIFVAIALIINLFIILFMPKRLTRQEIYITWAALAAIALNSDLYVGNILDLYDFSTADVQFSDLLVDFILPPSYGIIFLNFMPKRKYRLTAYIILWSIYSVLFEWATVYFRFEKLKGWTPWYSFPIYLFVFLYLYWHLHWLRKVHLSKMTSNKQ